VKSVVFGDQTIGCACLDVLLEAHVAVAGVVTTPDDPGNADWFRSLSKLAGDRSLPYRSPAAINDPAVMTWVQSLQPDILFLFDYQQHVGPSLLALPRQGAINLYATRLPEFPGYAPHLRAVMHGATATGVTRTTLHRRRPG